MDSNEVPITISFMGLEPSSVVQTVEDVTKKHFCTEIVNQAALTCFAKLSERYASVADADSINKIQQLIGKHKSSASLELQLRACEYGALLRAVKGDVNVESDDIFGGPVDVSKVKEAAKEALARMPIVDLSIFMRKQNMDGGYSHSGERNGHENGFVNEDKSSTAPASNSTEPNLLDLDDIFGGTPDPPKAAPSSNNQVNNVEPTTPSNDVDLLADIFSAPPAPVATPASNPSTMDIFGSQPSQPQPMMNNNDAGATMDLFSAPAPASAPLNNTIPSEPTPVVVPAFTKEGLEVEFVCNKCDKTNPQISEIVANFKNTTTFPIYGLNLQCAVPKYVTMAMQPPSSTTVPSSAANGAAKVTQSIKVTNTKLGTKNLMMKLKLSFTLNGNKVEHMATCNSFPAGDF